MLESVRRSKGRAEHVIYASSATVFNPPALYPPGPLADDAQSRSATLHGVHEVANEERARVYWEEHRVPSIRFRPFSGYGPGGDFSVFRPS